MNSATERRSSVTPQKLGPSCGLDGRLYPVPTGSRNTRSLWSSSVYGLSSSVGGGAGGEPSAFSFTRLGPKAPRCNHTVDDPGPPLNTKVMGRLAGSPAPSLVSAT